MAHRRGIIRGLWGTYDPSHRVLARRARMDKNIAAILGSDFKFPFKTYVFGDENLKALRKMGVNDVTLLNEGATIFDPIKYVYRHKLELIRYAMEIDGYDEVVYMDWDCVPQRDLPKSFWDDLNKKDVFQANLMMYRKIKCPWRQDDQRKVPNGGFLYIRDKSLPDKAIKYWDTMPQDNDEPAWAKIVEELMGGWKGLDEYWSRFEPMCCDLHRSSPFTEEQLKQKNKVFIHYQGTGK